MGEEAFKYRQRCLGKDSIKESLLDKLDAPSVCCCYSHAGHLFLSFGATWRLRRVETIPCQGYTLESRRPRGTIKDAGRVRTAAVMGSYRYLDCISLDFDPGCPIILNAGMRKHIAPVDEELDPGRHSARLTTTD